MRFSTFLSNDLAQAAAFLDTRFKNFSFVNESERAKFFNGAKVFLKDFYERNILGSDDNNVNIFNLKKKYLVLLIIECVEP